jgi:hypothetical protein
MLKTPLRNDCHELKYSLLTFLSSLRSKYGWIKHSYKKTESRLNPGAWYSKPMLLQGESLIDTIDMDLKKFIFLTRKRDRFTQQNCYLPIWCVKNQLLIN